MTNAELLNILSKYEIQQPEIIFLRHNENRTYRIQDQVGRSYLLRIHDPIVPDMRGLQHTYNGILGELQMLEKLGSWSTSEVQTPVRNKDGELITIIDIEGELLNCSVLTWLDGRDLNKDDFNNLELVKMLGSQIAELHTFFQQYERSGMEKRPSQGKAYNERMIRVIHSGVQKNLFTPSDATSIEQTLQLINSRLDVQSDEVGPDFIHGDLSLGNMIITSGGAIRFIDFGFFGTGYALLDVAMGALMLPSDRRDIFLEGYFRNRNYTANELLQLEGFMLVAIIGYYVFQMENENVQSWMRERMPKLCAEYCVPFLRSESIFYNV
ncbi:aminoglycoside phosphotransferase family protein [Paenibacillus sp. N1-5-1-14]|uniref:phosphotransferase enzyme family protein n=1 Tax=Paenibacillus radicibacter TaxID=2972488 RepID=UPI002158F5E2|nr:aminoglycoside phosphotransferase family protein [Paenibacillus radicibacter]MCR8642005.1 aminoglycoside phosphotransferase family protein [Paenibacillus radicibacter]